MDINVVQITGKKTGKDDPRLLYIPESVLDDRNVRVLGAIEPGGRLVGALAYRVEGFVINIVYVSVDEAFMRQGAATAMIDVLTELAAKDEFGILLEAYFPDEEEYEPFSKMLLARGDFTIRKTVAFYSPGKIKPKDKNMALYKKLIEHKGEAENFYKLSTMARNGFLSKLKRKEINDLQELWDEKEPEEDLCFCKRRGNDITAAVFIKVYEENADISYMYAENGRDLLDALSASLQALNKKYPKLDVDFSNLHEGMKKLTKGLFGDNLEEQRLCVARWNGVAAMVS